MKGQDKLASFSPEAADIYLFNEGRNRQSYRLLGARPITGGEAGTQFAVWAPRAKEVRVAGDFNSWQGSRHKCSSWDSPVFGHYSYLG